MSSQKMSVSYEFIWVHKTQVYTMDVLWRGSALAPWVRQVISWNCQIFVFPIAGHTGMPTSIWESIIKMQQVPFLTDTSVERHQLNWQIGQKRQVRKNGQQKMINWLWPPPQKRGPFVNLQIEHANSSTNFPVCHCLVGEMTDSLAISRIEFSAMDSVGFFRKFRNRTAFKSAAFVAFVNSMALWSS